MAAAPPPDLHFDPADPAWLAHRYDRAGDAVRYRHVPRARHGEGPFLTDELVGAAPEVDWPRARAVAAARLASGPIHFLFHSAFCASTLLTRALDIEGVSMGLSEPVLLNDVVGIRRRGEMPPPEVARLMDDALHLLARPWDKDGEEKGGAVVVKPSSILNPLAHLMLSLRPDAGAILLYSPLRPFLVGVARKGLSCRLWVRKLLEGQITDQVIDMGFDARDYFGLTDLQVAAVGWLVQHRIFAQLIATHGKRVRIIDSEKLLDRPAEALAAAGALFRLPIDADAAARIASGPAFTRHSKSGDRYDAQDRLAERAAAEKAYGEEVDAVMPWAAAVADNAGIMFDFPAQGLLLR
ncbi:hypothetical protein MNQ96_00975 [Sphingopyxis granuli]|uniref:hypothetical protein n=1 Tax=Sphingopyxis TaxID=165697 RepID=UPI000CDF40F7|nr:MULTISPECIES: hypothetical protein [Sphingopyxis]AVA15176.1 hypothetical protein C3E99_16135 [Sphingopyxis sp. MG]UNK79705.1 hypothetical protein MNQ96_00975 [Sphingopyxis granuli]